MRERERQYKGIVTFSKFELAEKALLKYVEMERVDACVYRSTSYFYPCDEHNRCYDKPKETYEFTIRELSQVWPQSDNVIVIKSYIASEYKYHVVEIPEDKEVKVMAIVSEMRKKKAYKPKPPLNPMFK